jgi:Ran-binding protein 3
MRIKVRQISQGVEDLNWKKLQNDSDRDEEMTEDAKHLLLKSRHPHPHQEEEDHLHPNDVPGANGEHGDANDDIVTDHEEDYEEDHDPIHVDTSQEENQATRPNTPEPSKATLPSVVLDQEAPLESKEGVIPTAPVSREPTGAEHLAVSSGLTGRSDSDAGAEKGLKRKYLERGTSQGPPESSKADDGTAKEGDAVEESQASPPPETQPVTERTSPPSPKVPKLVSSLIFVVYTGF